MTVADVLPDDAPLRLDRRARVLSEMARAGIDILVLGREANTRYISGTPRLWTAGSRAFGPGCILVREGASLHLLSTWDEGVPDDIPHENLYGISFNAMSFLKVLQGIEGAATARTVATDGLTSSSSWLLSKAFPAAEIVDGEQLLARVRRVKVPLEIEAIRTSVGVAERALAAAEAALAPGATERGLTGVFMEAMAAAGVTTPATQDVAWRTAGGAGRDVPLGAGDLVAFDAGVIVGGYVGELGRTRAVGGEIPAPLLARWDELWDRLVAACRPGAPASGLLDAYGAAGAPPPPMPVARGLGLGFDLPLVTHALPRTAAEERLDVGMVFALTAFVGGVYGVEPVVITESGPELLSTNPFRDARSR